MTDQSLAKEIIQALHRVTSKTASPESRHGQDEMAVLVGGAIASDRHLIVQAGTGTGKTLGYLVPAILSGKRVVISTVTKTLQDQLANNDLPLLTEALGGRVDKPISWSVLKGRNNYLCRQRLNELGDDDGQFEGMKPKTTAEVKKLIAWATTTEIGDQAELSWQPQQQSWEQVSVTSEECPGATRCLQGNNCFAEKAKQRAQEANIVVVNGWLYALDIVTHGAIIGEHEVVIFDEAHDLEDVISDSYGISIGKGRVQALSASVRLVIRDEGVAGRYLRLATQLQELLAPLINKRISFPVASNLSDCLQELRSNSNDALEMLRKISVPDESIKQKVLRVQGLLSRFIENIDFLFTDLDDSVVYVSGTPDRCRLQATPLHVGEFLQEAVWSQHTAILTSATIPNNLPQRLGLSDESFDTALVTSQFDYERNALLYCATQLPDPSTPNRDHKVHEEILALITAAGGRTLALFTSHARLNSAYEDLGTRLGFRILRQGDLPKMQLLQQFSRDETSCLFATQSFFQGIDVPGRTLSLVIVDRLPFPVPNDPVLSARREAFGSDWFMAIDVPIAVTKLAQAAGRLIRNRTDKGVIAILDPRLVTKKYGQVFVSSMPNMELTTQRDRAVEFLHYAVNNR